MEKHNYEELFHSKRIKKKKNVYSYIDCWVVINVKWAINRTEFCNYVTGICFAEVF